MGEDDFGVVSKAELLVRGSGTMTRSFKEKFGQRWMRRIPAIFEQFYYGSKFSRQRTKSFFFLLWKEKLTVCLGVRLRWMP